MASNVTTNPSAYQLYRNAEQLYAEANYANAATELEAMLGHPDVAQLPVEANYDARLLLARSYYRSAQLRRAESLARTLAETRPDDGYVALLIGRTLQRTQRADEARDWLRRAQALGQAVDERISAISGLGNTM